MSSIQSTTPSTTELPNDANINIPNCQQLSIDNFLTPAGTQRFTKEEKALLYELFKKNEEIIDIKHRKNSTKKITSVRECWERISQEYNESAFITTKRSMKQIQKFWLNARLRKSYPATNDPLESVKSSPAKPKRSPRRTPASQQQDSSLGNVYFINVTQQSQQEQVYDEHQIDEEHHQMQDSQQQQQHLQQEDHTQIQNQIQDQHEVEETSKVQNEFIENIKFENIESAEIETEVEMIDEEEMDQVEASTSSNDGDEMDSHHPEYTIDHISTEKLTLDDLLEFKNSRREEILVQIKSNDPVATTTTVTPKELSNLATYVTPFRITNSNINNSEHHTQYQSIQQVIQAQTPHVNLKPSTATLMITQQPHLQTSCCNHHTQKPVSTSNSTDNLEEKLNFFKLKGAELRYKEEQLRCEQSKIDLQRAKEQLKHMKEMHAFQIEEMKLKVKALMDEDNRPKTKITVKKH